ncbi:hypothetical protein Pmani_015849 [Petrolisthes manimaculis]|uniref:EGF-like domain-containing protein n=1 Tax=Petrolisthes manimaculis TaxID=1843537 RepID=A0AAE1PRJ4_9EUCA|nr:hypothetical protein Pmani_015849 [Petrolisthes manimaculis]
MSLVTTTTTTTTSTSSSLPLRFLLLLLLLLLAVPRLGHCEEDGGKVSEQEDQTQKQQQEQEEEGKQQVVISYSDDIQQKYVVVWADAPPKTTREWSTRENSNPDLTSVNCTSDENCTDVLIGLDLALSYPSNLPSSPYCEYVNLKEDQDVGQCTCGPGRCVSYSHSYSDNGEPFYYCGPCGWVGSQCNVNQTCSHRLAECDSGYCECIKDGTFYDMSYCYIPYYGKRLALEMLISAGIIVLCCAILAYGYTRLGRRRSRSSSYLERWTRGSITRQDPENDTPPTYDDVVEVEDKLPSYQDALEMVAKEGEMNGGVANPSFQPDSLPPPTFQETQPKTTPTTDYTLPSTLTTTVTSQDTLTTTDNLTKLEATGMTSLPESEAMDQQHQSDYQQKHQENHQQNQERDQQHEEQQPQPVILETIQPIHHPLQISLTDLQPRSTTTT